MSVRSRNAWKDQKTMSVVTQTASQSIVDVMCDQCLTCFEQVEYVFPVICVF